MSDIANQRLWQIAILTAAGTVVTGTRADAALYYWNGNDGGYYSDVEQAPRPSRPKLKRSQVKPQAKKDAAAAKEISAKPQGALVVAISIEQQRVRLYDSNGLYAESPVSTGMKGHATPMGVFSVIQKQKFHRSNIYSGAPMPFMQRITWSGVAMHAGVLPGYPASHGCIRMPAAFAVKMYNWTKMGARVIVTPGTISPQSFAHPLLVTQKVAPTPVADEILKMDAPLGTKSDKGADKPETSLDLRTSVGHVEQPASLRDNTHTADASGAMPAASASATMSDASSAASEAAAEKPETAPHREASADKAEPTAAEAKPANSDSSAASGDKAVGETAAAGAAKTEVSAGDNVKAEAKAEAKSEPKAEEKADAAKPATETPKAATTDASPKDAAKPDAAKPDAAKPDAAKPAAAADAPDAKKDPARLPSAVAKAEAAKRAGQIAVFISRKDSKLYVRQNFAPLFDAPVTIAPSDRPLGTHVFTAEADKTDSNLLRWSVVTLPTRNAARIDDEERPARHRKGASAAPIEVKPQPDSPSEALDRITIPADTMARITEALGTGGSIIVSDLGVNQGETGEGTDFIVPLR